MIPKTNLVRSKKLRASARDRDCTLRLEGICNFMPETTVLAHIGFAGGVGIKCGDNMAVYACSSCHAEIDGSNRHHHSSDILRAHEETQQIWIDEGLVSYD